MFRCGILLNGVALRFIEDGPAYAGNNLLIGSSPPEQGFQIRLFIIEKTGAELSLRGEPESVALIAKMMADRADKTNCAFFVVK